MTDTEALVADPVLEIKSFQLKDDNEGCNDIHIESESSRLRYRGRFSRRRRRVLVGVFLVAASFSA